MNNFNTPIELNLSCPNVNACNYDLPYHLIRNSKMGFIAKLPPIDTLEKGKILFDRGFRYFHLCNTIPCKRGGKSGKPLKKLSLRAVEDFRRTFGNQVILIGGGGVTELNDVKDYVDVGSDHVSIASVLFNPLMWYKIGIFTKYLEETRK